jgi:hypothetical protein
MSRGATSSSLFALVLCAGLLPATQVSAQAKETGSPVTRVNAPPFSFVIPDGWLNLSPGGPKRDLDRAPPGVKAQLKSGRFKAMGLSLHNPDGRFFDNLNALIVNCPGRFTDANMNKVANMLGSQMRKQNASARLKIISKKTLALDGTRVGRLVYDLHMNGTQMRQMQYYIPSGNKCAIITFTTIPDRFSGLEALFDKTARATGGIKKQDSSWFRGRTKRSIIVGVAVGLAALLMGLFKRKRG